MPERAFSFQKKKEQIIAELLSALFFAFALPSRLTLPESIAKNTVCLCKADQSVYNWPISIN
jgi:hypothetical protein